MKKILTLLAGIIVSMAVSANLSAQSGYEVKGVIIDQYGPVIGATVMEAGTSNGISTDLDGNFSLKVSSKDAVVEVSCIGYTSQSFTASQMPASITLSEDSKLLEESVVIGYGTVKKSDMTGAVTSIRAEDVNRGAVTSPSSMLLGKVSGLNITPASGQPGASSTIRIRGAASLTASNDPLIVIDGVPVTKEGGAGMGDPLATVNPNDIESYSVLKDASATAIYGSRASNGVIIITTKKGQGKGMHVSYSGSVSAKQNKDTIKMMDGETFAAYIQEYRPNSAHLLGVDGTLYNTDWQSLIYRVGINTDHNISLYSGGKFPFRVSVGYNLDQATIKVGDNQRGNIDVSLSPKFLDDHLSVNLNAKGVYQKTNWANNPIGSALTFDPTKPVYFTDAEGNIDKSQVSNGYWNWMTAGSANTMASVNPLSSTYDYINYGHTYRAVGNLQLDYKVHGFEALRANLNLGLDMAKTNGTKYNTPGSIGSLRSTPDLYELYKNFNKNTLLEAYLDYNETFGKHNVNAMAGYSWQHNFVSYDNSQYYNNDREKVYNIAPNNSREYYLISFFGRFNYNYDSRYLFTFTARGDASSRFSKANRWGFFPSAAFAWNIANEEWMEEVETVSALKLRLGWGRTGQQDIGDDYYPYLARYYQSPSVTMKYPMLGGENGSFNVLSPLAYNPNIKWETTETYNVGVDFGFLNDRISGSVEAYYRNTFDLLNRISIPLGSNFGKELTSNIGSMVNKGIELSANFIPVQTRDWNWEIGGNFTFQDVKITKLTNSDEDFKGVEVGKSMGSNVGFTALHKAGYAPYTYYLYQQVYDKEGNPVQNALVDRNNDGKINADDRYVTGCSPTPWGYFGFNTQLRYKHWDFGLNGHGSLGAEFINKTAMGYATSYSDDYTKGYIGNLSATWLLPGWTAANTEAQKFSDLWIEDGSFVKIDDINLGYTFDLKNNLKIRVAGSVQNVCTFTKYSGLDPEITEGDGVDTDIYPRPRLYTLRLNITF